MKLAEIDTLYVEVLLPAEAYGKVRPGAQVVVTTDIPPGSKHRATVKVIDPVMDAASGTFGVRLELPNPQRKLPGGIRCRADFPDISDSLAGKSRKPAAPAR